MHQYWSFYYPTYQLILYGFTWYFQTLFFSVSAFVIVYLLC